MVGTTILPRKRLPTLSLPASSGTRTRYGHTAPWPKDPRGTRTQPCWGRSGSPVTTRHDGSDPHAFCKEGTDGHLWFVGDESRLHDGFRYNGMGGPLHGVSVRISRALTKVCRDGHNGDDSKIKMPPAGLPGVV